MFGIKALLKRFQYAKYKRALQSKAHWGKKFCESPHYGESGFHLFKVHINNKTHEREKIRFGDYCNVAVSIFLNKKGDIQIGDYVFMNGVHLRIDHKLSIGSHCLFGPGSKIWDTSNHPLSVSERHKQAHSVPDVFEIDTYLSKGGNITIEDDVWIGMDALILGGVTIGKGSIVSARSVVTSDVPPMTIVGGVPARVIGAVPP